jgi:hypothetical protein
MESFCGVFIRANLGAAFGRRLLNLEGLIVSLMDSWPSSAYMRCDLLLSWGFDTMR